MSQYSKVEHCAVLTDSVQYGRKEVRGEETKILLE